MDEKAGLPIIAFAGLVEWESWLKANGRASAGIWLKLAKKGSGVQSITYGEAVEGGLCFGWIDSQKAGYDERFFLQRFTPRGPRSKWSQINREKVEKLARERRMRPAGEAEVQLAMEDGRWAAAYPPASRAAVPEDLQAALDAEPAAKAFFATLDGANRYAILYRVHEPKRADTRARRIEKFVAMLARGEKPHG